MFILFRQNHNASLFMINVSLNWIGYVRIFVHFISSVHLKCLGLQGSNIPGVLHHKYTVFGLHFCHIYIDISNSCLMVKIN